MKGAAALSDGSGGDPAGNAPMLHTSSSTCCFSALTHSSKCVERALSSSIGAVKPALSRSVAGPERASPIAACRPGSENRSA